MMNINTKLNNAIVDFQAVATRFYVKTIVSETPTTTKITLTQTLQTGQTVSSIVEFKTLEELEVKLFDAYESFDIAHELCLLFEEDEDEDCFYLDLKDAKKTLLELAEQMKEVIRRSK